LETPPIFTHLSLYLFFWGSVITTSDAGLIRSLYSWYISCPPTDTPLHGECYVNKCEPLFPNTETDDTFITSAVVCQSHPINDNCVGFHVPSISPYKW